MQYQNEDENRMEEIKIKYSSLVPPKGYLAITLFGTMYINKREKDYWENQCTSATRKRVITHESIHMKQAEYEGGYFMFYLKYLAFWIKAMFLCGFKNSIAYYCIPYEIDAFMHETKSLYNVYGIELIKKIPMKTLVNIKKSTTTTAKFINAISKLV